MNGPAFGTFDEVRIPRFWIIGVEINVVDDDALFDGGENIAVREFELFAPGADRIVADFDLTAKFFFVDAISVKRN